MTTEDDTEQQQQQIHRLPPEILLMILHFLQPSTINHQTQKHQMVIKRASSSVSGSLSDTVLDVKRLNDNHNNSETYIHREDVSKTKWPFINHAPLEHHHIVTSTNRYSHVSNHPHNTTQTYYVPIMYTFASVCRFWRTVSMMHDIWKIINFHVHSQEYLKPHYYCQHSLSHRNNSKPRVEYLTKSATTPISTNTLFTSMAQDSLKLSKAQKIHLDLSAFSMSISLNVLVLLLNSIPYPQNIQDIYLYLPWSLYVNHNLIKIIAKNFPKLKKLVLRGKPSFDVLKGIDNRMVKRLREALHPNTLEFLWLDTYGLGSYTASGLLKLIAKQRKSLKTLIIPHDLELNFSCLYQCLPSLEHLVIVIQHKTPFHLKGDLKLFQYLKQVEFIDEYHYFTSHIDHSLRVVPLLKQMFPEQNHVTSDLTLPKTMEDHWYGVGKVLSRLKGLKTLKLPNCIISGLESFNIQIENLIIYSS